MDKHDITKYSEILDNLTCFGYKYKYIYEKESTKCDNLEQNYRFIYFEESFVVKEIRGDEFGLFFYKPKKVKYHSLNRVQELVFSTLQIDDFMKSNKIEDLAFDWDGDTLSY